LQRHKNKPSEAKCNLEQLFTNGELGDSNHFALVNQLLQSFFLFVRLQVNLVRFSVEALRRGVARAHVVPPQSGDLLRELYTTDGAGTLIARDLYDGIRKVGRSVPPPPGVRARFGSRINSTH
jgi:hypothetical protein